MRVNRDSSVNQATYPAGTYQCLVSVGPNITVDADIRPYLWRIDE